MSETYTVYSVRENGDERVPFMQGVSGKDVIVAAFRLRQSGLHPVVYSERDNQRIFC